MIFGNIHAELIMKENLMEVFYLKINRPTPTTWHYLKMWLDITQQFPVVKTYIICDNPDLQAFITNNIGTGGGMT